MNEIRRIVSEVYGQWSSYQAASWLSHWIVAGFLVAILGVFVGFLPASKVVFLGFVVKEVLNAIYHLAHNHKPFGKDGWVTDGVMDLVGPALVLLCAWMWTG